ncbi:hypothetical protein [Streptomyces olivaceus]|uniref:hypothetical protein n=1 Tax=Streptomyces olivaceus TaxID=47716 RepID=UPI0036302346
MNDEELKAQAIQDPEQAERLIAIESARANAKLKLFALLGVFVVIVVLSLIAAALFVVDKAGDLKLPWSSIGTSLGTFVSAPALGAAVWWGCASYGAAGAAVLLRRPRRRVVARAIRTRWGRRSPVARPPDSRAHGDGDRHGHPEDSLRQHAVHQHGREGGGQRRQHSHTQREGDGAARHGGTPPESRPPYGGRLGIHWAPYRLPMAG